ncbi:LacI family DNA-binding transcriptional regulator [Streptomyces sp. NPDC050287]|uniref:LacI family DNA-binding transcriptional regulator n=1 Tax=Streptomyces sp. NPDC050287 TaxID=3365608 RepID=UPI0037AD432D
MPGKHDERQKLGSPRAAKRRTTIDDVAKLAGVSRQTVSRAINDKGEIDPATKERVLQATRTLGYRPSRFAQGMRRQDSVTLGLIISDLSNPYFAEVAVAVLEVAGERGWHVIVCDSRNDEGKEREALDVLSRQADAIIGHCAGPDDVLARHAPGMPLVLLERGADQTRFGSVGIDAEAGMRQAFAHLTGAGHHRIGMLDGSPDDRPSARREHFLAQAGMYGLPVGADWVVSCDRHNVGAGERGMDALLDAHPDVTAVVGFNDLIAVGAIRTARRRGLRVPDDVAVLGFDGLALGELVEPPLTTLSIDKRELGRLAVEQVAAQLSGDEKPPAEGDARVRPELVLRASA